MDVSIPLLVRQSEYRTAVALNNLGVMMMERGCYRQGFETFKDALLAMKMLLPWKQELKRRQQADNDNAPYQRQQQQLPPLFCSASEKPRNEGIVAKLLQRARSRMCAPYFDEDLLVTSCRVKIVPHDAATRSTDSSQASSSSDDPNLFSLVRIENDAAVDLAGDDINGAITVCSMSMLYNFGIASMCFALSSQGGGQPYAQTLATQGIGSLRMCRKSLASNLEICVQSDYYLASVLLHLWILVNEALHLSLSVCGAETELRRHCVAKQAIPSFSNWILQQQQLLSESPAPAA